LGDRHELLKSLKKELRSLKRKYADPRRSRIISDEPVSQSKGEETEAESDAKTTKKKGKTRKSKSQSDTERVIVEAAPPPTEDVVLEFTHRGYVRGMSAKAFEKSQNSGELEAEIKIEETDDFVVSTMFANTGQNLVALTRTGKAYPLKVTDIPLASSRSSSRQDTRGVPLATLLSPSATKDVSDSLRELVVAQFLMDENATTKDLVMLTQEGKIKRLSMSELTDITNRGITVIKLKEDDELRYANLSQEGEQAILTSSLGRCLRLEVNEESLPIMGRAALGSVATRMRKQEELIGCLTLAVEDNLLLISEEGYGKRIPVSSLRIANRGGIGQNAFQFSTSNDVLTGMAVGKNNILVQLLTNEGRLCRIKTNSVPVSGNEGTGKKLLKLQRNEKIVKVI
jgi:DNA gyrase subunit A